jgi:hypothetical protein
MNGYTSLLLIGLVLAGPARASETLVVGRASSQKIIENVEVPCPDDHICMHGWNRWVITIHRTVAGPPVSGRVRLAVIEHGLYGPDALKRFRAFVIAPIEDPEKRKLLGAEYYLLDRAVLHEVVCFDRKPQMVEEDELFFGRAAGDGQYCIDS